MDDQQTPTPTPTPTPEPEQSTAADARAMDDLAAASAAATRQNR